MLVHYRFHILTILFYSRPVGSSNFCTVCLPLCMGDTVALWLARWTPDRKVQVQALAKSLCSWALYSHSASLHPGLNGYQQTVRETCRMLGGYQGFCYSRDGGTFTRLFQFVSRLLHTKLCNKFSINNYFGPCYYQFGHCYSKT